MANKDKYPNSTSILTDGSLMPDEATQQQAEIDNSYQQPAPATKTTQDLLDESKTTGRSYLDLYNQYAQKPEYDQTRVKTIQRNKNFSILADILKTVAEGVTTGAGGKPIQRQSVAPTLDANLQGLLDKYQAEASAYKNDRFKYMLQDEVDKRKNAIYERRLAATEAKNAENMANFKATFDQRGVFHADEVAGRQRTSEIQSKHYDTQDKIAEYNRTHPHIPVLKNPDRETNYHIVINGKSTLVPISLINDVTSRAKQGANIGDPVLSMQPAEVFAAHWPEFYSYNGQFVSKENTAEPQIRDRKGKFYTPVQKPFEIQSNIITKKKVTDW